MNNWSEFDAWCLVKGINPLDLPAYRFYNLIIFAILEDKTDEQKQDFENQLRKYDAIKHVFHQPLIHNQFTGRILPKLENGVVKKNHQYIPPWYNEETAYKNAMVAMKGVRSLPK